MPQLSRSSRESEVPSLKLAVTMVEKAGRRLRMPPLSQALPMACVAALLAAPTAVSAEPLSGDELRQELTGNTLSGFNTSGVVFTEYHAPDGRVLGYNQGRPNQDACWTVRGNAVCYYYPRGIVAGEYCWLLEPKGPMGFSLRSVDTATTGVARLAPGNANQLSDNDRPWTCQAHVSEAPARVLRTRK